MKKILILTALVLSFVTFAPAQESIDFTVQEMKVLPKVENCCCNPKDIPATLTGQVVTNGLEGSKRVTIVVSEIVNFVTVAQYRIRVGRFGVYRLSMNPCKTYVVQPHIQLPASSYDIWEPGSVVMQDSQPGETYTQNFVLTEILVF